MRWTSTMSPAVVRPVTKRLPASRELWDDTNLPMCAVLTPAAGGSDSSSKNTTPLRPLASIPKCLNCGAPQPTRKTHFRPVHKSTQLCYLCWAPTSTLLDDQQEAREEEVLDPALYDQVPPDHSDSTSDHVFEVPLFSGEDQPQGEEEEDGLLWEIPAKACPPVWWIVLDASQSSRSYWARVAAVLEEAWQDMPPHVHVGLVAASATHCTSWDLTSALPHAKHYSLESPEVPLCLVPADALHKAHLQAALRAIADAQPGALAPSSSDHDDEDGDDAFGMALGLTIEIILEFMKQGRHPGGSFLEEEEDEAANPQEDGDASALRYAGGKILCLLGNPPLEVAAKPLESQPPYHAGGVAGSCRNRADPSDDDDDDESSDGGAGERKPSKDPSDPSPSNLKDYLESLQPAPEGVFETIGTACADAALGVDLLVVVPEEQDPDEENADLALRPFYGIPLLRIVSSLSGSPGPLLFGSTNSESTKALSKEVLARAPWSEGMVFGVRMRSRISKGFRLEDSPIEKEGDDPFQLAPFLSSGGLSGPGVVVEPGLWAMGSCDPHTSAILDFEAEKTVNDAFVVDGFGEVGLKPVLQVCVAFSCIEQDAETGRYQTVRRVRVSNASLPLARDVEPIFDALDPEALAVVLFHKLLLSASQEGLSAAQDTAEGWLKSLLVCVYQSAQVEQAKVEELMDEQGVADPDVGPDLQNFVGRERLLDIEGDLDEEDILLGAGHPKVAVMPLILYALMQCDALRPTEGPFKPSLDARSAALAQLASMTPAALSKCIAPSLQLWSAKDDEVISNSVDLSYEAVEQAKEEFGSADAVFLADSPQEMVLARASEGEQVPLGPRLRAAVDAAAKAYRTRPPIRTRSGGAPAEGLINVLLEDVPTVAGHEDFADWKEKIAKSLRAELKQSGDIEP